MLQQEKNLDKMLLPWHLSKHQAKAPTVCTTVTMSPWQREGYVPLYPGTASPTFYRSIVTLFKGL